MGSYFEDMAQWGADLLLEIHGERDGDFVLEEHVITLPSGLLILWPASVGELSATQVEVGVKLEVRETCLLVGRTSDLPAGYTPFPPKAEVVVTKYGLEPFNVDYLLSRYGGPMTTISLLRRSVSRLGDNQHRANA